MNSGQILLTLCAMFLLSLTTLRVNSHFVSSGVSLDETKFSVLAVSLASSKLEEANSKAFDENTCDNAAIYPTDLTSTLGRESQETGPSGELISALFDDCDDFHNYWEIVDSIPSATFRIDCLVNYVNPTTPNVSTTTRTWNKKITVMVSSPAMTDTIKMSSIYSYWYYR